MTFNELSLVCAIALSVIVFGTACGRADDVTVPPFIDSDLRLATDEFLTLAEQRGLLPSHVDLPQVIVWATLGPDLEGECLYDGRRVLVDITYRDASAKRIRSILWHELAHCMYYVHHDPLPGRIMSAQGSTEELQDWQARVDELFQFIKDNSPIIRMRP